MPQKLTRAQIKEGLDTIPIETLLMSGEGKRPKLTVKQKAFAHAIALGESKAQAYRVSHKAKPTKATITTEPYKLARDPRITREIEHYRLALESEKHRNPVQLKALLVQQLVQHSLDEGFPPAQRMKALQLIGNLFEVGAFLERKEVTTVRKSVDIRTRLLERLGTTIVIDDGLTLLDEIKGGSAVLDDVYETPTEGVDALEAVPAPACAPHTVPDNQTLSSNVSDVVEKKVWGGVQKNPEAVLDFDKE
jgi:hypothetical protein